MTSRVHVNADATQPEKQLLAYWQQVESRGDKPKPAYVVFELHKGLIVTWSLSRREMVRWLNSLSYGPASYRLAKVQPA